MSYWWSEDANEKYWVEIRHRPGIGLSLSAPNRDERGRRNGFYDLVGSVKVGEVIYHWDARQHRIVGRSRAAADAVEDANAGLYTVELSDFRPIATAVDLKFLRSQADRLYELRDKIVAAHGVPTFLPFQYKQDRTQLAFMSNYFTKLPASMVNLLFGSDGLASWRSTSNKNPSLKVGERS